MRTGLPAILSLTTLLLALPPVAASPIAAASDAPASYRPGRYVDIASTLTTDDSYSAWYALRSGLDINFDEICGDTFCEGDYSNIQSLRFQCSVNAVTGRVGMCSWTFAASDESIDARSGAIVSQTMHWQCRAPLVRGTTVEELFAAVRGDRPLYATLPHTDQTIYDGLVGCL